MHLLPVGFLGALTQDTQLKLAHRALQSQQKPVV